MSAMNFEAWRPRSPSSTRFGCFLWQRIEYSVFLTPTNPFTQGKHGHKQAMKDVSTEALQIVRKTKILEGDYVQSGDGEYGR